MLRDGTVYHDLGASHFDRMNKDKLANRLVRRLQHLGYQVDVQSLEISTEPAITPATSF